MADLLAGAPGDAGAWSGRLARARGGQARRWPSYTRPARARSSAAADDLHARGADGRCSGRPERPRRQVRRPTSMSRSIRGGGRRKAIRRPLKICVSKIIFSDVHHFGKVAGISKITNLRSGICPPLKIYLR